MRKLLYILLVLIIFIFIGCSNSDKRTEYIMNFKGKSDLLSIKDEVEGYYLNKETSAKETHSFQLIWLGESLPQVITIQFKNYDTKSKKKLYLESIGESNIELLTKGKTEVSGADVLRFTFDSNKIPADIESLLVNVKYEYGSSAEVEETSITMKKIQ